MGITHLNLQFCFKQYCVKLLQTSVKRSWCAQRTQRVCADLPLCYICCKTQKNLNSESEVLKSILVWWRLLWRSCFEALRVFDQLHCKYSVIFDKFVMLFFHLFVQDGWRRGFNTQGGGKDDETQMRDMTVISILRVQSKTTSRKK